MASHRFTSLSKRSAQCRNLIGRLDQVDTLHVMKEIATEITRDLRQLEQDIKTATLSAEEEDSEASRQSMLKRLHEYHQEHDALRALSQEKIRQARQRIETQAQKERQELFSFTTSGMDDRTFSEQYELRQRSRRGEAQAALKASASVTGALEKTNALMRQEIDKSALMSAMLAESSQTLSNTHTEYKHFGTLLGVSRRLIRQLEASDWLDRLALLFGLILFCSVTVYVVKKRTWDVGISWVTWMTKGMSSVTKQVDQPQFTSVSSSVLPPTPVTLSDTFDDTPISSQSDWSS